MSFFLFRESSVWNEKCAKSRLLPMLLLFQAQTRFNASDQLWLQVDTILLTIDRRPTLDFRVS